MIGGDFSRLLIGEFWDGLELEVRENHNFNQGQFSLRAMLTVDCAVTFPTAFVVASSIT